MMFDELISLKDTRYLQREYVARSLMDLALRDTSYLQREYVVRYFMDLTLLETRAIYNENMSYDL